MQSEVLNKNLYRYSLLFSLATSAITTIILSITFFDIYVILYRSLIVFILLFIFSSINIKMWLLFKKQKSASFFQNKALGYILSYIICLVIVFSYILLVKYEFVKLTFLPASLTSAFHIEYIESNNIIAWALLAATLLYFLVLFFQSFVIMQMIKNQAELELVKLKLVNTETSFLLLMQQIQPHFLFNSLNTLKSLIRKYPNTAEEYLVKLSELMRASVIGSTSGKTTVIEELKHCQDYLEMQKIRFGGSLIYKINVSNKESLKGCLPFFSLQALIENAIKHNKLTDSAPLTIEIAKNDNYITVSNNLQRKKVGIESTGVGLSNLAERYKILSGDEIIVNENKTHFSVSIKIIEDENSNR